MARRPQDTLFLRPARGDTILQVLFAHKAGAPRQGLSCAGPLADVSDAGHRAPDVGGLGLGGYSGGLSVTTIF